LEELWAIREEIMRESDYDIRRMGEAERARMAQLEREGYKFTYITKPPSTPELRKKANEAFDKAQAAFRESRRNGGPASRMDIIFDPYEYTHRT
jgi:hypothetical protein